MSGVSGSNNDDFVDKWLTQRVMKDIFKDKFEEAEFSEAVANLLARQMAKAIAFGE